MDSYLLKYTHYIQGLVNKEFNATEIDYLKSLKHNHLFLYDSVKDHKWKSDKKRLELYLDLTNSNQSYVENFVVDFGISEKDAREVFQVYNLDLFLEIINKYIYEVQNSGCYKIEYINSITYLNLFIFWLSDKTNTNL